MVINELNYLQKKIDSYQKTKHITWSEICYNDFETDSIISPHEPYRN